MAKETSFSLRSLLEKVDIREKKGMYPKYTGPCWNSREQLCQYSHASYDKRWWETGEA
jgi:hypothetical protein